MTRKTRIVAIDKDELQSPPATEIISEEEKLPADHASDWDDVEQASRGRTWGTMFALFVTFAAIAAWTTAFVLAYLPELQHGGSLQQWTAWMRDWAVPVLLIAMIWLIAMRNSRREAARFGRTARILSEESTRLESRLSVINRELSLAREFIAAQARDIDSIGRVATERLSEHADRLASLIADNGNRLDSIQTVSAAALDNMERLRGHLPVIASSAKDVTNNIGAAGRAANTQVEELVDSFSRLNAFGQASEQQVANLKQVVGKTLAEFAQHTDQLGEIVEQRFAALTKSGAEFRAQLEIHEVEALAKVRSRATALAEELEAAREVLDAQENESLTSLRARLAAIRDESGTLIRSLREGENTALQSWEAAIARLEGELTTAITRLAEVDQEALSTSQDRLAELARAVEQFDEQSAERNRQFAAELEMRQTAEKQHGQALISQCEAVVGNFELLARRLEEIADIGGAAEERIAQGLVQLTNKLTTSREALAGTDRAVADLTDSSVRLLELIQASVQQSSVDLPQAMASSETKLVDVESRVTALRQEFVHAEQDGERIVSEIQRSSETLKDAMERVETLSTQLDRDGSRQSERLEAIARSLELVRTESLSLAEDAQDHLNQAIKELEGSAQDAVKNFAVMSASSVADVATKLGEESAAAIDRVMQTRVQEVAGQLELAAASAAEVSREAALQLHDQLARIGELTAHLEQRVARARSRAEDQVDNDFARRVALITESLNSNSIDIVRVIDSEVTDTAWSAYLKGDRGIFTRRAVRLLDKGEIKAIAGLYGEDRTFRDHVSRYIHDFEAMLRQLLSTRDGHALGVTLLSSDMGKLYVALAQAIERLRN